MSEQNTYASSQPGLLERAGTPGKAPKQQTAGEMLRAKVTDRNYVPPTLESMFEGVAGRIPTRYKPNKTHIRQAEYARANQPKSNRPRVLKNPPYDPSPVLIDPIPQTSPIPKQTEAKGDKPTDIASFIQRREATKGTSKS